MASPDGFLSSPLRVRHETQLISTSSPDLPSLHSIIPPKDSRPSLKSGSRAAPIPDDAETSFMTARNLWKSAQAAEPLSPSRRQDSSHKDNVCDADDSIEIIQIQPKSTSRARKVKQAKKNVKSAKPVTKGAKSSVSPTQDQPWKKYQAKAKSISSEQDATTSNLQVMGEMTSRSKETGTMSSHFADCARPELSTKMKSVAIDEPLCLEPAMTRRVDWTPPSKDKTFDLKSSTPTHMGAPSSEIRETSFKTLDRKSVV